MVKSSNKGSDDDDSVDFSSSDDDDCLSIKSDEASVKPKKKTSTPTKNKTSTSQSVAKPTTTSTSAKPAAKRPASEPVGNSKAKVVKKDDSESAVPMNVTTNTSSANLDITRGPPVTTDVAAKKLILQYMRQQNRPYSAIQVHDNLHKRIPKSNVERVLTALSSDGAGLLCKEYGKAKIYFIDQSTLNSTCSAEDLDELQRDNEEAKKRVESSKQSEKQLNSELSGLLNEPSDSDLARVLAETESRVVEKTARLTSISSSAVAQDPHALSHAIKGHNYFRGVWLTRKHLCMNVVEAISEGVGKKVKDVMSEMCIETDVDAGTEVPGVIKEPVRK